MSEVMRFLEKSRRKVVEGSLGAVYVLEKVLKRSGSAAKRSLRISVACSESYIDWSFCHEGYSS